MEKGTDWMLVKPVAVSMLCTSEGVKALWPQRQRTRAVHQCGLLTDKAMWPPLRRRLANQLRPACGCLLYPSDAADERSSGSLGGRRVLKKHKTR